MGTQTNINNAPAVRIDQLNVEAKGIDEAILVSMRDELRAIGTAVARLKLDISLPPPSVEVHPPVINVDRSDPPVVLVAAPIIPGPQPLWPLVLAAVLPQAAVLVLQLVLEILKH